MKKEFNTIIDDGEDINYYYSEWHISGELKRFLDAHMGKKVKITIEFEEEEKEETVTVTYKELFNRGDTNVLLKAGVNLWYLNEGGDPNSFIVITKDTALRFMSEEEFNGRKND